ETLCPANKRGELGLCLPPVSLCYEVLNDLDELLIERALRHLLRPPLASEQNVGNLLERFADRESKPETQSLADEGKCQFRLLPLLESLDLRKDGENLLFYEGECFRLHPHSLLDVIWRLFVVLMSQFVDPSDSTPE